MVVAQLDPQRRTRLAVAVAVAALHVAAVALLVRAFAPSLEATVLRPVIEAFDVTVTPPPAPQPQPQPRAAPSQTQGAAAPAGKKASPREVTAPKPPLVLATLAAPPVAGAGPADSAGAAEAGAGTGAGGNGQGTGAGGLGTGGGGGTKAIKIAGDIVSARDYLPATRALRLGSAVTIALSVGIDGRVTACRVVRASRDPQADRITCQLATERFRFRPARDAAGQPVASVYGWQQRWFAPAAK